MKAAYILINLIISTVLLTSCLKTENLSANQDYDTQTITQWVSRQQSEKEETVPVLKPESTSAILRRRVPELEAVSVFLEKQSKGKAHLIVQDYDAIYLWSEGSSYIPVFVGEEWEDGRRVIWYWFYICEDTDDIIISLYQGDRTALLDWRQGDQYQREMNLIQDSFTEEEASSYQLDSWLGSYSYSANKTQDQDTKYEVTIDKIIDKYYADISISSPELHVTIKAEVKGNQEKIDFLFYEVTDNREGDFAVVLSRGDKLFSLLKNGMEIETQWDALYPVEEANQKKRDKYFQKDEEARDSNVTEDLMAPVNVIKSKEPITKEAEKAYNDFLNGRSFIQNEEEIRLAEDIMRYGSVNSNRKYTVYNVTGDSEPELILQGSRMYILSYDQGGLSVWETDDGYAGDCHFVNGGNLYYEHQGMANKRMHAYEELDDNGESIRSFSAILYAQYNEPADEWTETYFYYEGAEERELTKKEYEEMVEEMSKDDEIDWQEYKESQYFLDILK